MNSDLSNGRNQHQVMPEKQRIMFATVAQPGARSQTDSLLLMRSIRDFGGGFSEEPILCLYPESERGLPDAFMDKAKQLKAEIQPFAPDNAIRNWFADHACAAAFAESHAQENSSLLVWLSPNAVVVQEPSAFLLSQDVSLGYRPVHHALIGSRSEEELDPFWKLIYELCGTPHNRAFPMKTHVEDVRVRPYFNAGFLVVRPDRQLLREWKQLFASLVSDPRLESFYVKDRRYDIFVHQALLSGLILHKFSREEICELPPTYNYPVHLHKDDGTAQKPPTMDNTVVFRHEGFYENSSWTESFPASDELKEWLRTRTQEMGMMG